MTELPRADSLRHVHFVAVAGVGMASLATLFRRKGVRVTGSDRAAYPPMSTLLERERIDVRLGFSPENLEPRPDLVVIGNAVSKGNPESAAVVASGIPYASMSAALAHYFLSDRESLVVAGTHGKTTSTSLLAWVLEKAGHRPGFWIGGHSIDFDGSVALGEGASFVVEGDEYDTAWFDKGPKFLHYRPRGLVITAVEFDHADIYRDFDHVVSSFVRLLEIVPKDAPVVANAGSPGVLTALDRAGGAATLFGAAAGTWTLDRLDDRDGRTHFDVVRDGRPEAHVAMHPMGAINALNALGVYALCRERGLEPHEILPGLETFHGVRRRQEVLRDDSIVVIDDFAHHPTAIGGVIDAVRRRYPSRRLIAVFEPRSNTSRRKAFQADFVEAFAGADAAWIAPVFRKETDSLAPEEMLDVGAVVSELEKRGVCAGSAADDESLLAAVRESTREGDVLVFMSNGAFDGLPGRAAREILAAR